MIPSPLESAEALQVGSVEFVSPGQIKVALDIEAPESIALNAGSPRPFPRVNSYVLIPNEAGYLVGQIEWLTVEPSPYPKRKGMKDFGLIDLPYPLRKMSLNPLGTLAREDDAGPSETYLFHRGVDVLPSVGDPVLVPTTGQIRAIVASGEEGPVKIGTSLLAGDADVRVDPNRLFGRHLAVLGNTGSGKSCSVAGLIRWSLEAVPKGRMPNARFIVLDPNGEYARAFGNDVGRLRPRQFSVVSDGVIRQLRLPVWLWNTAEWSSASQASTKTQRPTLVHALRLARGGQTDAAPSETVEMRRFLRTLVSILRSEKAAGTPWGAFPKPKAFLEKIEKWSVALELHDEFTEDQGSALSILRQTIQDLSEARQGQYPHYDFTKPEVDNLIEKMSEAHQAFGGVETDLDAVDADAPVEFSADTLLKSLEASAELLDVSEYVETMMLRVRTLLGDAIMAPILSPTEDEISLSAWLESYVGGDSASNGCLAIIDLSLVPSEVVHIVTAVTARIIFESLQRYRKVSEEHHVLPTVLVMEEAHTFVQKYSASADGYDPSKVCCQVFERIAREGRKFGLGLVLASQRPSELSPTVLSQCNSFLLHRITNDRDQDLVNRYVPDNLKGLLGELPSLPSQNAILLGWATEIPVLVRMSDLPKEQQPQSDDPDFWEVWTGQHERRIDWKRIADSWQGRGPQDEKQENPEDAM